MGEPRRALWSRLSCNSKLMWFRGWSTQCVDQDRQLCTQWWNYFVIRWRFKNFSRISNILPEFDYRVNNFTQALSEVQKFVFLSLGYRYLLIKQHAGSLVNSAIFAVRSVNSVSISAKWMSSNWPSKLCCKIRDYHDICEKSLKSNWK